MWIEGRGERLELARICRGASYITCVTDRELSLYLVIRVRKVKLVIKYIYICIKVLYLKVTIYQ